MQIIIPMSGFGERFRQAGYDVPKPLIEVEGKPMIAHVIDLFPGEGNFIFICNQVHLDEPRYRMREILQQYCPTGRIMGIPAHKRGPIHAVLQIMEAVDLTQPVIVNYCDFTCYWNWAHFKQFVQQTGSEGCIPAYKGFHPHSLGSTNYAYMREQTGWVQDIQEKEPYTDQRMNEFASSGSYYFSSGWLMQQAFNFVVDKNFQVGGEFYVSLAYQFLFQQNKRVSVYPLQHFMQWGTPQDVAEYNYWSQIFHGLMQPTLPDRSSHGCNLIPMAGLGQRFVDAGYAVPKPLIAVSGQAMVVQACHDLPPAEQQRFILRRDMAGYASVVDALTARYPAAVMVTLDQPTQGQACTVMQGLETGERPSSQIQEPITIGACDNGALYDAQAWHQLWTTTEADVIVWAIRGYPNAARYPQMYGWIDAVGDEVRAISVKTPLGDPTSDPVVTGTFTFRRLDDLRRSIDRLMARQGLVNGEYYVDACINDAIALGLKCRIFEVNSYICWGTPNDLQTFEYWQSCFDKWMGHPYQLDADRRVPPEEVAVLRERYREQLPSQPQGFV